MAAIGGRRRVDVRELAAEIYGRGRSESRRSRQSDRAWAVKRARDAEFAALLAEVATDVLVTRSTRRATSPTRTPTG